MLNRLKVEITGASHADRITIKVNGLPKGAKIDVDKIQAFVDRRKASASAFSTKRLEGDIVHIASGIENGVLTGDTFEAYVINENKKSQDYENIKDTPFSIPEAI